MRVFVGTCGASFQGWGDGTHPERSGPDDVASHSTERLDALEINNTFYRLPSRRLLAGWSEKAPTGFSVALKAPRRITHQNRLRDSEKELASLLDRVSVLGDKLGPLLFQLPPFLRRDLPRFVDFLELLPAGCRVAFEFRHPSWFAGPVLEELRLRNLAVAVADTGSETDPPRVATADYGYLRLRRARYGKADLEDWASWAAQQNWRAVWAFFSQPNRDAGPRLARQFRESLFNVLERRNP